MITRECLRNRTWAPVNISQCVMNSDSPVVMIVTATLDTTSISLVKSKEDMIIQEVCCFPSNRIAMLCLHDGIYIYIL